MIGIPTLDNLSEEEIESAYKKLCTPDPITFDDLYIWTRDNPPKLSRFTLNAVQEDYLSTLKAKYKFEDVWEMQSLRENALKARQQGYSTFWLGVWYLMLYNLEYSQTIIITHRVESTRFLWERIRTFERMWPKDKEKPKLSTSNRRELIREDTGASLFIGTAGQDDLARSGTVTNVHLSETAFWPKGTEGIRAGVLGTLPDWGNLIEESTANGLGDHYERYQTMKRDNRTYFSPWFKTPEYCAKSVHPDFKITAEELAIKKAYDLSDGQILWRRRRIIDFRDSRREGEFPAEFPANDIEAFTASGNPYFNRKYLFELLTLLEDSKYDPIEVMTAEEGFLPSGTLKIWEQPVVGFDYVIGADVAEGIEEDRDHDYSTAIVICKQTWKQVATYRGRPEPSRFGDILDWLGKKYRNVASTWQPAAFLGVERNNHGHAVLARLMELDYPNLYFHRVVRIRSGQRIEESEAGYPITIKTKVILDDLMADIIHDASEGYDSVQWVDKDLVEELIHYVKLPGGKAGAEGSGHDDLKSGAAIAVYLLRDSGRMSDMERREWETPEKEQEPMYGRASRLRH